MMQSDPPTTPSLRVLILDDEATIRSTLSLCLQTAGHHVADYGTGRQALDAAAVGVYDLLFLDLRLGTENGLDYIPLFLEQSPWLKIVVITAYASIETAVEAMRRGAVDYLSKPFTPEQVEILATKIVEVRSLEMRVRELQTALGRAEPDANFSSRNHTVQAAYQFARTIASSRAAILLQGETGTGKRMLARAIHEWSPRRDRPFMVTSCAGRSEDDIAAELFGTGATANSNAPPSRLEQCFGGTLYVDEFSALTPRLQLKIHQVIQDSTFEREGHFSQVPADVRIVAGTHHPIEVVAGALRSDLFYTLSAKLISLPALRDRPEDLSSLAEIFLAFYSRQSGKLLTGFKTEAFDYLKAYAWPGNIRELRNVVERAAILANGPAVGLAELPPNFATGAPAAVAVGDLVPLETIEEQHIRGILSTTKSFDSAAKILGIDYATLWRRRRKYGL
jgi:NtrC-family two-component system response regulator AlgB